ncbi:hypothetical protein AGMMS49965_13650 [Bacteroidia bacterium]|nr:hypothetical protein AGMMS49965_13650 [Bacteroidia bacterium]
MKMLSDIEICLDDRKRILNERFVWNDEAINGIRTLSQRLVDAEQLVVAEYDSRKAELESRIQQKDKFLTDFIHYGLHFLYDHSPVSTRM